MKRIFYVLLVSLALLLSYQNCGDVSLGEPVNPPPLTKTSFEGSFCVSKNNEDSSFELKNLLVVNITAKLIDGQLYPDSDMDGIVDHQEESYGLDPLKARSHGILDSICKEQGLQNCEIDDEICSLDNDIATGLKECDLVHVSDSAYKGLNSDANDLSFNFDTIPDYIEIIKGTDLLEADSDIDSDGDLKTNEWEIKRGRNPRSSSDSDIPDEDRRLMQYTYSAQGRAKECNGSNGNWLYNLSIDPPLVEVEAYDDDSIFSHEEDENVILIYVVSQNSLGETEFWLAVKKIHFLGEEDLQLESEDFFLEGHY